MKITIDETVQIVMIMELNKTLTVDDFITAFVEYEEYKTWHESCSELIGYYRMQLELMQELFGYDLTEATKRINTRKRPDKHFFNPEKYYEFNTELTIKSFENCIKLLNVYKSPFDYRGMMEGMPPKINRDLKKKHGKNLDRCIENLEIAYRDIAKDLLIFMFPGIDSIKIEYTKLYELGLPTEEPDFADFF